MSRIDELLEGITIEDVIEREGLDYKLTHGSRGEQLNLQCCPFCGDDRWRVYINRDEGLGNCFAGSCGETFNLFKFTKQLTPQQTSRAAIEYLEAVARDIGWRPRRHLVVTATDENPDWELPDSYSLPTKDGRNLQYLEARGITGEIAKLYGMRYCQSGWFNYLKEDGSKGGMNFGERVILPVYDLSGTMVTFQGRDITGTAERKYLFPPGLPGTSAFLYDAHTAIGKRRVVICEGIFDVIATKLALLGSPFDHGVVGSFGLSLSSGRDDNDQLSQLLKMKARGLEEVVMMWDGEKGAFAKALEAAKKVLGIGLKVKVAQLPAGKDPGEAKATEVRQALEYAAEVTPLTALRLSLSNPYRGSHS